MNLIEAVIVVLDQCSVFQKLDSALLSFNVCRKADAAPSFLTMPFEIHLDVLQIMEISGELANLIVDHSHESLNLFQQVICKAASVLGLTNSFSLHPSQILIHLMPHNLPLETPITLFTNCLSLISFSNRLVSCSGILSAISPPSRFLEASRYICSNVNCEEDIVTLFFPGELSPGAIDHCHSCGSNIREDVSFRRISDMRTVLLSPLESLENKDLWNFVAARFQSLKCILRGDFPDLHLGGRYQMTGCIVVHQSRLHLDVLHVEPVSLSVYVLPHSYPISPVIEKLYHDRRFSPWSFALSLAFVFASEISPVGSFFRLKLGILISLVACGSLKYGQRLPLLVISGEVSVRQLLQQGAKLSRRHVQHTAFDPLLISRGSTLTEAGSLLLARGGVCFLGDISNAKTTVIEQIQKALELGSVTLSSSSDSGLINEKVLTQIWAIFDASLLSCTGEMNSSNPLFISCPLDRRTSRCNLRLRRALLESFGVIYVTDTSQEHSTDDMIIDIIFKEALGVSVKSPTIPLEELKCFLEFAGNRCLEMEPVAEHLIRGYFVASRRALGKDQPDVPFAAVATVSNVAHAFAQLSMAEFVNKEHAAMAILLYEESLVACYGHSSLAVKPLIHVNTFHLDEALGKQNDSYMYDFLECLVEFIEQWGDA